MPHRAKEQKPQDWLVDLGGLQLYLEAKGKAQLGHIRELLGNAARGLAMLPHAGFMREFEWESHAPDNARSGDLLVFLAHVVADLREVDALLKSRREGGTSTGLRIERLDNDGWSIGGSGSATLSVRQARHPRFQVVSAAGRDAFIPRVLGAKEEQEIGRFSGRLGIRSPQEPNTLFVVAWPVPWAWEYALDMDWAKGAWKRISSAESLPASALWPRGAFNVPSVWLPNASAHLLGAPSALWS